MNQLSEAWLDDYAQLGQAVAEVRQALHNPHRSKSSVQRSLDRFVEVVRSRFEESAADTTGERRAGRAGLTSAGGRRKEQEAELLEQVLAMSMLARSGVETLGWWQSMQRRIDDLAKQFAERISGAQEDRHSHSLPEGAFTR